MNDVRIWPGIVLCLHNRPSMPLCVVFAPYTHDCSETKRRNSNDVMDSVHGLVGKTLHKVAFTRQGNHMSAVQDGPHEQIPHCPYTPKPEEPEILP